MLCVKLWFKQVTVPYDVLCCFPLILWDYPFISVSEPSPECLTPSLRSSRSTPWWRSMWPNPSGTSSAGLSPPLPVGHAFLNFTSGSGYTCHRHFLQNMRIKRHFHRGKGLSCNYHQVIVTVTSGALLPVDDNAIILVTVTFTRSLPAIKTLPA